MNTPYTFTKVGRIYGGCHCQIPVVTREEDRFKVYVSNRDESNRSRIIRFTLDAADPAKIIDGPSDPVMPLGVENSFDEKGTMTASTVDFRGKQLFYYTGWSSTVYTFAPYRHSIGLAVGDKFEKMGPVIQSTEDDFCLCSSPFVVVDGGTLRMWFVSGKDCGGFTKYGPVYSIRYAESSDGFNWKQQDVFIPRKPMEIFARPFVFYENNEYHMFYTWLILGETKRYQAGYAVSPDGLKWQRITDSLLPLSESGWDSEMIAFPYLIDKFLFYSGNGFGREGFGYALQK